MVVDGVNPQGGGGPAVECGQQVVVADAGGEQEAADDVRHVGEGIPSLQPHQQRPRGDQESAAARLHALAHVAKKGLRALPARPVGGAVHVPVPAAGVAPDTVALDAVARESDETGVPGPQPRLAAIAVHAAPIQDPVVEVGLARLELFGAHGVVEDHAVYDDVRLEGEDAQEQVVERREVVAAPAAVEDLPAARLRARVEQAMEDARVDVLLLDPHPLREGIADHGHAHDARGMGPDLRRPELLRAVPALHGEGREPCRLVEPAQADGPVVLERRGVMQIDVEVSARVAGVAVQEHRPAPVGDAVGMLEGGRRVAAEPKSDLDQAEGGGHAADQQHAGSERGPNGHEASSCPSAPGESNRPWSCRVLCSCALRRPGVKQVLSMEPKRAAGMAVALLLNTAGAHAQVTPSPAPSRLRAQDELDLQARASVVEGSGARALGMGGAFLARADDATAASWNPAGLSYLRLAELSAVWTQGRLQSQERLADGSLDKDDRQHGNTPDFFAATYPIGVKGMTGSAQLSFQRVISFRSHRTIEEFSPLTVESSGGFDVLALGAGLQVSRWLRLGFTVNRWFNGYTQHSERTVNSATRPGMRTFDTEFRLSAWNTNLGAIVTPSEQLSLGAVFKTGFSADVELDRQRVDVIAADPALVTANDHSRDDLVLDFPAAAGAGVSFRPLSNFTASLDYTRSFWSKGRIHNFFTLPRTGIPEETEDPIDGPNFFPDLPYPTLVDPEQQDTEQVRVGLEYVVIRGGLKVPVRVGYFNERQYFRSIAGSAPRFDGLTAGAGIIVGRVLFDAAYVYEHGRYTDPDANSVRVNSHRVFASFIYRHARR
jgi:long-subunit fatty acid transport protein